MSHTYFTEEHELFRTSLRDFIQQEVTPHIDQWEEEGRVPRYVWEKMGDMGFLGLAYPTQYGGQELDFFFDVVFNEEMGRINSGGFIITQQVVQYMSSPYILKFGSDRLKEKYLPGIISGRLISSIGITEPGAGSDVANIQTKAIKQGDHYVVNGAKTFITNGVYGDFVVTVVKTKPEAGLYGISLLVIDTKTPGVSARKLKKLGWHASDTAEFSFDNVHVPIENLIGEEGNGFFYLMNGLQLERICALPTGVVAMETALAKSLQYMSERQAFGRSIDKFQVLRHRIALMYAEVSAMKAFVYHCCTIYSRQIYDVKLCSMAKMLCSELHQKQASECLQFFGGYGFMEEYPMARMYRDVRVNTIGGGSSEIMREIIAKMIVEDKNYEKASATGTLSGGEDNVSYFNEEHQLFRRSLKDFLAKEVTPYVDQWEKDGQIPRSIYQKFGEMGYLGLAIEETYGGSQLDIWYSVILFEELARVNSGGFAAAIGAHAYLAMTHIHAEGNHDQKTNYLIPGVLGQLIGCMAVTEPNGGSDVKALQSTAVKDGDHYIVNGAKTFITNGVLSDYIVAAVKTDMSAGLNGLSMVIIDRNAAGVSATNLNKLGWHASDTGEIAFSNVRIPANQLLGEENQGFYYIMKHFVTERLSMAVGAVASAQYALELTLKYIREREAFGKPLNRFQVLRHKIAELAAEIEMNRQFVYSLYHRHEQDEYLVKEASMAKLTATKLLDKVTFECLQMYGGYGFMEDYPLARMWRDARLGQIGGGTSEILCEIIAKMIIDHKQYEEVKVNEGIAMG